MNGRLKGQKTLHPLLATISTPVSRPVQAANRMRRGNAADVHGAKSFVEQALATARAVGCTGVLVLRADAKFFTAEVCAICHNLTRTAGVLAGGMHTRATAATVRAHLINIPTRIASKAGKITFHMPDDWPWREDLQDLRTRRQSGKHEQTGPSRTPRSRNP